MPSVPSLRGLYALQGALQLGACRVGHAAPAEAQFAQGKPQRVKRLRIALRREQSLPHESARLCKQALHSGESVPD
jgi:hypothetical protein